MILQEAFSAKIILAARSLARALPGSKSEHKAGDILVVVRKGAKFLLADDILEAVERFVACQFFNTDIEVVRRNGPVGLDNLRCRADVLRFATARLSRCFGLLADWLCSS